MYCSRHFIFLIFLSFGISACSEDTADPIGIPEPEIGEFIDQNTYRVFPKDGDNFDVAEFRLWVPELNEKVRAVLVLLDSNNSNAMGLAKSTHWQAYATSENLAILAVHLKTTSTAIGHYSTAQQGSGQALLTALTELAMANGQDYLKELPFLLRGYSAGGVFSYSFSTFQSQRTLAFANLRGGSLNLSPDNNLRIPGMMIYGEFDVPQRNQRMVDVVRLKRQVGANWCVLKELGSDHFGNPENADNLIKLLFSKVLERNLQEGTGVISEIPEVDGWLGDPVTLDIDPFEEFVGNKSRASWLIDKEFAEAWVHFQSQ